MGCDEGDAFRNELGTTLPLQIGQTDLGLKIRTSMTLAGMSNHPRVNATWATGCRQSPPSTNLALLSAFHLGSHLLVRAPKSCACT